MERVRGDHRRRHGRLCPGLRGGRRGAHRRSEDAQKKAGTYGITGLYHTLPQVDLGDVVRREIKIFGTICYTRQEFEECLHFVEDGRVKVEPFITHHFPLKDMEKAYEVYQSKQCIKIILNP